MNFNFTVFDVLPNVLYGWFWRPEVWSTFIWTTMSRRCIRW